MEDLARGTMEADALIKPDMQAVLERTNLSISVHGFLLPIFEALSNSLDGIEHRFGEQASQKGKIAIKFENLNDPSCHIPDGSMAVC